MSFLNNLTVEDILYNPLPLHDIISSSLFYPASSCDGNIIRHTSEVYQSYIYCDYGINEQELTEKQDTFIGYSIFASRSLPMSELFPNGWQPQFPANFDSEKYNRYRKFHKEPFAKWLVYTRNEVFGENYGPKRFSILFLAADGIGILQKLYFANNRMPKAVAIIQPGFGFGGNYTNFKNQNEPFALNILNIQAGTPDVIYYGGYGKGIYNNLTWPGYAYSHTIKPYYKIGGEVTVWKKY